MNYDPTEPVMLINMYDEIVTITQEENPNRGTEITATVRDDFNEVIFVKTYTGKTYDEIVDRWYAKGYIFL